MLNLQNIFDTIDMIDKQHLDIRTITMGISLLDCVSEDANRCCQKYMIRSAAVRRSWCVPARTLRASSVSPSSTSVSP